MEDIEKNKENLEKLNSRVRVYKNFEETQTNEFLKNKTFREYTNPKNIKNPARILPVNHKDNSVIITKRKLH